MLAKKIPCFPCFPCFPCCGGHPDNINILKNPEKMQAWILGSAWSKCALVIIFVSIFYVCCQVFLNYNIMQTDDYQCVNVCVNLCFYIYYYANT